VGGLVVGKVRWDLGLIWYAHRPSLVILSERSDWGYLTGATAEGRIGLTVSMFIARVVSQVLG
jgi:Na+/H+ antiporter NhaA